MRYFLLIFIFSFFIKGGNCQNQFQLNGYQKYIFTSAESPFIKGRLSDHLLHTRINCKYYGSDYFTATLEGRIKTLYGNSLKKNPGYKESFKSKYDFYNLDHEFWSSNKSLSYAEIDRLNFDYTYHSLQLTAGRQRIAWGTSLVWNIIDFFNPKSILDFDYEELPGADAIRIQYYTGALSRLEAVYAPGKNKESYAAMFSYNYKNYDLLLIAGKHNNKMVFAGGWNGYIKNAGFRGEFKISEPLSKKNPNQVTENPFYTNDKIIASLVLGWDYTFSNSLYVHSEILYNSNGKTKNTFSYSQHALSIGMLSAAKLNFFQEFSYDINPLWRASVFSIINGNDHSFILVPSLNWSVITNLDLTLLGYLSEGDKTTEYGPAGNLIFSRLKYSF